MWIAILALVLGVLIFILDRFVIKARPIGGWFATCIADGNVMVKVPPSKDVPDKIRHCMTEYNLPLHVVRKYVCQKCGRELWIAPEAKGMDKPLYVGRKA